MEHYEAPEFVELGEASELTLGIAGRIVDGCCGCFTTSCGGGGIEEDDGFNN